MLTPYKSGINDVLPSCQSIDENHKLEDVSKTNSLILVSSKQAQRGSSDPVVN